MRSKLRLLERLRREFSWTLALAFVAAGAALALLLHEGAADFDRRDFVKSADDRRLAYETQGQGPPLVALAGGPGISHHGFHPYLGLLGRQATVVYFDPRGRGESDSAPSYRVADDVRDLDALRRGLRLARMDLLGVSYGAHLAVAYALEHPRAVRKLVLVSPVVGRSAWEAHLKALIEAPGMQAILARIREKKGAVLLSHPGSREQIIRALLPLYWCDPTNSHAHLSVFRSRHRIMWQNFEVYESIVGRPFGTLNGDLSGSTIERRLAQIEAPTLLVHGGCDQVIPKGHVRWLEKQLPRARRVFFPTSGHSPFIDQAAAFTDEVGEFLSAQE
ncbi:MAG: alpha/beta fold hydrolase [Acidobacteriota bacterium]